ncbi:MAG TPA: bile acid:sodium symporter [Beutenbergiaceae bacterium]|nr:bile acid:sodium symporter [Beutenbergiaceae bacterium]
MDQNPLVDIVLPPALFIIMVGIGLTLTTRDFSREFKAPRGMILATVAQLLVMPLLSLGIAVVLSLPPVLTVGLMIIAACPGGTTSNLITYLARGNVALSIVLTVIASLVAVITLPIATDLTLQWQPSVADGVAELSVLNTVATLVAVVLLPVSIGMFIRHRWPRQALRAERAVSVLGTVVLAILIIGLIVSLGDEAWTMLTQAGLAAVLLSLLGTLLGVGIARLARLPFRSLLAVGVELGQKKSTLGILIGVTILGSHELAVPSAVYGLVSFASALLIIAYGRTRISRTEHLRILAAESAGAEIPTPESTRATGAAEAAGATGAAEATGATGASETP